MAITTNIGITLVEQSQAQKEITVNEAFARVDALLNRGAIDKDWTSPPASPADGDIYLVGTSATDGWAGHDGEIAYFEQIWRYIFPQEGALMWIKNRDGLYVYKAGTWTELVSLA